MSPVPVSAFEDRRISSIVRTCFCATSARPAVWAGNVAAQHGAYPFLRSHPPRCVWAAGELCETCLCWAGSIRGVGCGPLRVMRTRFCGLPQREGVSVADRRTYFCGTNGDVLSSLRKPYPFLRQLNLRAWSGVLSRLQMDCNRTHFCEARWPPWPASQRKPGWPPGKGRKKTRHKGGFSCRACLRWHAGQ